MHDKRRNVPSFPYFVSEALIFDAPVIVFN